MTCDEFKALAHALAVGALEPAEREAAYGHLAMAARHAGCEEELRRAIDAASLLAAALPPVSPAEDVWRRIEERVGPSAPVARAPAGRRRWFAGWLVGAAAVAAMAVLWISDRTLLASTADERAARIVALQGQLDALQGASASCRQEIAALRKDVAARDEMLSMLHSPTTAVVALAPMGGAAMHASALYDRASRHAMVVATGLAAQPGKDYELWVIRGGDKLPAGLLRGEPDGAAVAHVDQKLFATGGPDAFAVTLEPAGGGAAPRGPVVLAGTVSKG